MADETTTIKKASRVRKTISASTQTPDDTGSTPPSPLPHSQPMSDTFTNLINQINSYYKDFENLHREIEESKINWEKQQKQYQQESEQNLKQQEILRKREQEEYDYETRKQRKLAEDEFADKKASWEKDLQEQKDKIADERKELEQLRKMVEGFESEKEKAVKQAQDILMVQLNNQFGSDKKLREQEIKSEKDILNLRIGNLTAENSRQAKEIEDLKKTVDEATKQVKEIAVRVIEASSNSTKNITPSEN